MNEAHQEKCIFCDHSKIATPITDHGDSISFEPLNPVVPGHRLVVPKEHVTDFTTDPAVTARVMSTAARIAAASGGAFNLITSKGKDATQSVYHLHVHLVPRKPYDEVMLPWGMA